MKYDGTNLKEVLEEHRKWLDAAGELDEGRADFSFANLSNEDLSHLDLYGADLHGAFMLGANLYMTSLKKADLTGVNLFNANVFCTNFKGAINPPFIPMCVPDTGSFVGWKRIRSSIVGSNEDHYPDSIIAKLLIPEEAQRIGLPNLECRASKVKVLELQTLDGKILPENAVGYSLKDRKTEWRAGTIVTAARFNTDRWEYMVPGIYFYLNRQQAVEYLTFGRDPNGNPYFIDFESFKKDLEEANHW